MGDAKGAKKAAILLIALGKDVSSTVFKQLTESEIEALTLEIANLGKIPPDQQYKIVEEFYHLTKAQEYIAKGGVHYAMEVLEKALGPDRAKAIIDNLSTSLQTNPFEFIKKADPTQVLNFIQGEQPQTIALILAYLPSELAAQILSSLPEDMQSDVAKRIAQMDQTSPDVVSQIEKVLEMKLSMVIGQDFSQTGGVRTLVDVLNKVNRTTERTILDSLGRQDPELAEEVRKMMFVFEDILLLDDRSMQRVLKDVENKDLSLALKTCSDELKAKIFKNMSERAAENLKEEMEYLGPVRLKQVEEAQQRIVNIIRSLDEAEEIVISREGDEEKFV
ncbi:MAG: flagellar motor switch protein FliG [Candidatus Margulisiibacteriota bacterium]|nr:MAG: flagellar motor switch protein FliG [Candidatus Margulisbacteria bacterium GWD2_39_127]OGI05187.1 MAG: flagellar motor switch protein FliG [Candidatus Margulisbacteria bacterium GWF2_38_17]OGI06236.1 MAG: flagellar motor switch protein FliG [Candidatus Margulisbacteria bacterium GWE2_39_32]PZM78893.1 MAG: flagellar motor switch protein FliG [Candidatus Margulisiibacteriota bacterium]HAR64525.1 flagellar motor switch protein FliG [Candidatus Margulisiibacteriota bacterium]